MQIACHHANDDNDNNGNGKANSDRQPINGFLARFKQRIQAATE